jgi:hypothetical protein
MKMERNEKMMYGEYFDETYHGNYVYRRTPTDTKRVEGILIIYHGDFFDLKPYLPHYVDKDGNPIR